MQLVPGGHTCLSSSWLCWHFFGCCKGSQVFWNSKSLWSSFGTLHCALDRHKNRDLPLLDHIQVNYLICYWIICICIRVENKIYLFSCTIYMTDTLSFYLDSSTSVTAPAMVAVFPAYYIFNSLLILLLVLHVIWTYLILRVVYNSILMGQVRNWNFHKLYSFFHFKPLSIPCLIFFLFLFSVRWRRISVVPPVKSCQRAQGAHSL